MIETLELLMKTCVKFDLLFMNIQCATARSLRGYSINESGIGFTWQIKYNGNSNMTSVLFVYVVYGPIL